MKLTHYVMSGIGLAAYASGRPTNPPSTELATTSRGLSTSSTGGQIGGMGIQAPPFEPYILETMEEVIASREAQKLQESTIESDFEMGAEVLEDSKLHLRAEAKHRDLERFKRSVTCSYASASDAVQVSGGSAYYSGTKSYTTLFPAYVSCANPHYTSSVFFDDFVQTGSRSISCVTNGEVYGNLQQNYGYYKAYYEDCYGDTCTKTYLGQSNTVYRRSTAVDTINGVTYPTCGNTWGFFISDITDYRTAYVPPTVGFVPSFYIGDASTLDTSSAATAIKTPYSDCIKNVLSLGCDWNREIAYTRFSNYKVKIAGYGREVTVDCNAPIRVQSEGYYLGSVGYFSFCRAGQSVSEYKGYCPTGCTIDPTYSGYSPQYDDTKPKFLVNRPITRPALEANSIYGDLCASLNTFCALPEPILAPTTVPTTHAPTTKGTIQTIYITNNSSATLTLATEEPANDNTAGIAGSVAGGVGSLTLIGGGILGATFVGKKLWDKRVKPEPEKQAPSLFDEPATPVRPSAPPLEIISTPAIPSAPPFKYIIEQESQL